MFWRSVVTTVVILFAGSSFAALDRPAEIAAILSCETELRIYLNAAGITLGTAPISDDLDLLTDNQLIQRRWRCESLANSDFCASCP
jgi:hypothetical protein